MFQSGKSFCVFALKYFEEKWFALPKIIAFQTSDAWPQPITACCFNAEGTIFAYSIGYDWTKVSTFLWGILGCVQIMKNEFRNRLFEYWMKWNRGKTDIHGTILSVGKTLKPFQSLSTRHRNVFDSFMLLYHTT